MTDWKPGMLAECIDDFTATRLVRNVPIRKTLYTVRNVVKCGCAEVAFLHLEEVSNVLPFGETAFRADCFRPIVKPSISALHGLLAPSPRQPADAVN